MISISNLGKAYTIGKHVERARYNLVSDSISQFFKQSVKKVKDVVQGRELIQGTTTEDFWALRDLNLEIEKGEVLGIIGRNCAGKSTLLKILSRITEPSEGRVRLRGRVASLLEVGTGFHPELTGRENVFLNGAILGMSRREIRQKFDEIVDFADVRQFVDTPVKRYSSGMYVRLAFSVAAHLDPEVLIVDEVLAVGDASFQEKCMGKMKEVSKSAKRTILFVSHNMQTIQSLCSRAVLLERGTMKSEGAPSAVIKQYFADTAANSGTVKLDEWADRVTSGDAKIERLDVLDASGNFTESVNLSEDLHIRVTLQTNRPIKQPLLGVLVHSLAGEATLDLRSAHFSEVPSVLDGRFVANIVVPSIGLYPGEYSLSPWIYEDSSKTEVDWVRHCCTIRILPPLNQTHDLRLDPAWGKYFVKSEWKLEQA